MIRILVAAVSICFLVSLAPAQDAKIDAKKVVGLWQVVKGNLPPGSTFEFGSDLKLEIKFDREGKSFSAKGTYAIEGNRLKMKVDFNGKAKNEDATITRVSETEMTIVGGEGISKSQTELKRKAK